MNRYLVKLDLMIGGVEKTSVHLVSATSQKAAGKDALMAECHNPIGDSDTHSAYWHYDEGMNERMHDFNGEMVYTVSEVTPIDEATYAAIKSAF